MIQRSQYRQLADKTRQAKNILITSHSNPDGDAIGSALGLYNFLTITSNAVLHVMVPNKYPSFLKWLPGNDEMIIFEEDPEKGKKLLSGADLVFCLDYNSPERVIQFSEALKKTTAIKACIDHHPDPYQKFDHLICTIHTSSTAELVYNFFMELGGKEKINKDIAECIYVGIMTDTGSFSYLCNHPNTYRIVADLMEAGVDGEKIHGLVYATYSEYRLRLLGFSLSERLKIKPEFKTAFIYLSKEDMKRFHYQEGDLEGVVNYPLSIKGIVFSAIFREQGDKIRISFRSKGDCPVNKIASEHFKGGGHKNAAGADSFLPLEQTIEKFESLLPQYKDHLNRINE